MNLTAHSARIVARRGRNSRLARKPLAVTFANARPKLYVLLLSSLLMCFFAPVHPTRFVKSDSGVFLYIGQQILNGYPPYRHAWDHKPPLIFYLDALGLLLGGGSLWGVWLVAFAACAVALWLCYQTAARAYNQASGVLAVAGMAAFLMATMEYANIGELYAAPLQVAIMRLYVGSSRPRAFFMIGVLSGLLFLLRPNLIAVGLAVAIVSFKVYTTNLLALAKRYGYMLLGLLLPPAFFAAYFAANGQLRAMCEAAILFNVEYSSVSWATRIASVMPGVNAAFALGLALLIAGGVIFAGVSAFQRQADKVRLLVVLCVVDLALEIWFSSLSGRGYLHYFMTWAASLGLLSGYVGYLITQFSSREELWVLKSHRARVGSVLIAIVICLIHVTLLRAAAQKFFSRSDDIASENLARYVEANTSPAQKIFVWGYGSEIYVMSRRASPSRYFMHTPLAVRKFADQSMILEIVRDSKANQPQLIIDSSYRVDGKYPHLDREGRESFDSHGSAGTRPLAPLFAFIDERYERLSVPGIEKWVVYALKSQQLALNQKRMESQSGKPGIRAWDSRNQ